MKQLNIALALAAVVAAGSIAATYQTLTGSGTTSAAVIIPPNHTQQARVTSLVASSDDASSVVTIYQGTMAAAIWDRSLANATNIVISPSNGVVATSKLLVQGAGGDAVVTVTGTTARTVTNVVNGVTNTIACANCSLSGQVGYILTTNNNVELLSTVATLGLGSNSYKSLGGDFALNPGRGGYITTTGTTTCRFDAVTVKYEPTQ